MAPKFGMFSSLRLGRRPSSRTPSQNPSRNPSPGPSPSSTPAPAFPQAQHVQPPHLVGYPLPAPTINVTGPTSPFDGNVDPELRDAFVAVDEDGSGSITPEELGHAFRNKDWSAFEPQTLQMLVARFDDDGSGTINFNEFVKLKQFVGEWQNYFNRFDSDSSGDITRDELTQALGNLPAPISVDLFDNLHRRLTGEVSYNNLKFDRFIRVFVPIDEALLRFNKLDEHRQDTIQLNRQQFLELMFGSSLI